MQSTKKERVTYTYLATYFGAVESAYESAYDFVYDTNRRIF
jgi:hypothetical protein